MNVTAIKENPARKWWALGALSLAVVAVSLDSTVLSVALPTLAGAFHASESQLQWFTSGYLLVLAAVMLPAGLLGDTFGRKRLLLVSLALFGVGSAACAFAANATEFTVARLLLGLAGAAIVVMVLAAFTVLFNDEERPRAIGIWAAANFLALPLGPILGGWMLTNFWWGWVFLINVPVAAVGVAVAAALVPESRAAVGPGLDPAGIAFSTAGLVSLVYGFIRAGQDGWGDVPALAAMAAGLVLLLVFFLWETRLGRRPGGQPLIDVGLFKFRSFTWGVVLSAVAGLAMIGSLFTMPQYFQGVLGVNALGSGLRLLPLVGGLLMGTLPAAWVVKAVGAKVASVAGFAFLGGGMAVGTLTGTASSNWFLGFWLALVGIGMGLVMVTASSAALSQLDADRSGVGSAVLQAVAKVGAPLGAAILGSVLHSQYLAGLQAQALTHTVLSPGVLTSAQQSVFAGVAAASSVGRGAVQAVREAFVSGLTSALWVSVAISLVGLVLAALFMPRGATERDKLGKDHGKGARLVGSDS
ncbi:DHA2 family efflux MFS transporter permease subunit [Arthrobacter sp. GMC3]|uniref:DHA2 family efflux MFS transporter permease subunit n=1 Tax=Arthrobacter sp. GMC3 TaxID=2058894 RepID=UPI000CE5617E|nr:DHA2 family efflux MFS transporter permease subunit [Arthrobacter sp. GMC3]